MQLSSGHWRYNWQSVAGTLMLGVLDAQPELDLIKPRLVLLKTAFNFNSHHYLKPQTAPRFKSELCHARLYAMRIL